MHIIITPCYPLHSKMAFLCFAILYLSQHLLSSFCLCSPLLLLPPSSITPWRQTTCIWREASGFNSCNPIFYCQFIIETVFLNRWSLQAQLIESLTLPCSLSFIPLIIAQPFQFILVRKKSKLMKQVNEAKNDCWSTTICHTCTKNFIQFGHLRNLFLLIPSPVWWMWDMLIILYW